MIPLTYYWSQLKQSFSKRRKDTSFRTDPFIDLILASTALPYQAKILCVGPRNAGELAAWRMRGYQRLTGLDLLPIWDRAAWVGDMHRMPFADNSFDLLYASHCFEHAYDFGMVELEILRVLKVGGWLFAAFPIHFTPTAHDRYDFGSATNFLRWFEPAQLTHLWHQETPTEVAVLARVEAK